MVVGVQAVNDLDGAQKVRALAYVADGSAPCLPAGVGEVFTFRIDGAPLAVGQLALLQLSYSDSASVHGTVRTRTYRVTLSWADPPTCTVDARLAAGEAGPTLRTTRAEFPSGIACLTLDEDLPVAPEPWLHSPGSFRYEHRADGWHLLGEAVAGGKGQEPKLVPLPPGGRTGDPGISADTCVAGGEADGEWLRFTWRSVGCLAHPPPPGPPPRGVGLEPGQVLRWTGETWVQHDTGQPVPLAP